MKRKFAYSLGIVVIAALSAANVWNSRTKTGASEMRLANVAALAVESSGNGETSQQWGCGGNPTFVPNESLQSKACMIFGLNGTHLVCKTKNGVCCDPSKQTDCKSVL